MGTPKRCRPSLWGAAASAAASGAASGEDLGAATADSAADATSKSAASAAASAGRVAAAAPESTAASRTDSTSRHRTRPAVLGTAVEGAAVVTSVAGVAATVAATVVATAETSLDHGVVVGMTRVMAAAHTMTGRVVGYRDRGDNRRTGSNTEPIRPRENGGYRENRDFDRPRDDDSRKRGFEGQHEDPRKLRRY